MVARPGKRLHNYGKSPFLMGKPTISMAMFNSFLHVFQRVFIIMYPIKSHKMPLDHHFSSH